MLTPFEIESMEIIAGSILAAAAFGTVVISLVGTLTYLLTREPGSHSPTAQTVRSEAIADRAKQAA